MGTMRMARPKHLQCEFLLHRNGKNSGIEILLEQVKRFGHKVKISSTSKSYNIYL
jgi:hypothetical protein